MTKRGRPRKNGAKDGWVIGRMTIVLSAFDEARKNGEKYEAAIEAAVAAVDSWYPKMPISISEVKRILAQWRPKGCEETMLVKEEIVEGPEADIYLQVIAELAPEKVQAPSFDKSVPRHVRRLVVGFGPAPHYPRHNARNPTN